jgi:ectoine hydroxylase-related dioxygenase (phytanoyl-CoA dioxygenase family)
MISERDVAFYRDNGYVVVPDVLEPGMLDSLRREMNEVLANARTVTEHTDLYDLEPGHRPDDPRVRRVKTPHKFLPAFEKLSRYSRLVEIVGQLVGGDGVRLLGSKLNMKSPRYGSPVEWHQDWAFYPHTNDDLLAVGVMLDDYTLENGPLLVVPGSHKGPVWDHHDGECFCGAVDPSTAKAEIDRAVPLLGRAGSMSFHHVRALHGSAENVSDRQRALLLYEYAAADAWPLLGVKDFADFNARLITGEPSVEPRLAAVPVRMPLPPAVHQGSIYENQSDASRRYFAVTARA